MEKSSMVKVYLLGDPQMSVTEAAPVTEEAIQVGVVNTGHEAAPVPTARTVTEIMGVLEVAKTTALAAVNGTSALVAVNGTPALVAKNGTHALVAGNGNPALVAGNGTPALVAENGGIADRAADPAAPITQDQALMVKPLPLPSGIGRAVGGLGMATVKIRLGCTILAQAQSPILGPSPFPFPLDLHLAMGPNI